MISLAWPWALVALAAGPLLVAFWWWTRRRRRRDAVRLPSVALIRAALPASSPWRHRLPAALFGAGLLLTGLAVARPHADLAVPVESSSIMLAIDVSGSMCTTDIKPNRLSAAQDAARSFVAEQRSRVGLVAFAGFAGLLVPPTTDTERLTGAIDRLQTWRGTAIGMAILQSIDAIAETNPQVAPTGVELPDGTRPELAPDVIVVLTDGANTRGTEPVEAAALAAARGIRVYTIGFGTNRPAPVICDPDQAGPQGGFGRGWSQQIEEGTLIEVAELTGGEYYRAVDAPQLTRVLLDLPRHVELQTRRQEVTFWFALAGALLAGAGVALSLWWARPRPAPAVGRVMPE